MERLLFFIKELFCIKCDCDSKHSYKPKYNVNGIPIWKCDKCGREVICF